MNENEFELNSKRYVAKTVPEENRTEYGYSCAMCAFEQDEDGCFSAPPFYDFDRNDHRVVVFIEAENKE